MASTRDFLKAYGLVRRCTQRRTTLPVLACIRLSARAGRLTLTGTDLDTTMAVTIDAPGQADFDGLVMQHKALAVAMRALSGSVTFKPQTGPLRLVAKLDGMEWWDNISQDDEFPGNVDIDAKWMAIVGSDFMAALERCIPCISTEKTRYYLNGVLLEAQAEPWTYNLVSTDGHKLMLCPVQIPTAEGEVKRPIIARDLITRAMAVHQQQRREAIKLEIGTSRARFTIGNVVLLGRLIDGTFPDYPRVVPKLENCKTHVVVERAALRRLLAAMWADRMPSVRFTIGNGKMRIERVAAEWGGAGEIDAEITGPGLEVGFNRTYLAALLDGVAHADKVQLHLTDMALPMALTVADRQGMAVLMPMRV